jgi:hypothetical protein
MTSRLPITLATALSLASASFADAQEADADCPVDLGEETLGETALVSRDDPPLHVTFTKERQTHGKAQQG